MRPRGLAIFTCCSDGRLWQSDVISQGQGLVALHCLEEWLKGKVAAVTSLQHDYPPRQLAASGCQEHVPAGLIPRTQPADSDQGL